MHYIDPSTTTTTKKTTKKKPQQTANVPILSCDTIFTLELKDVDRPTTSSFSKAET